MYTCVCLYVYGLCGPYGYAGAWPLQGLGLYSHVRSDDLASQACWSAKGILYLAMTRTYTPHEEAISPRREIGREGEKGEG